MTSGNPLRAEVLQRIERYGTAEYQYGAEPPGNRSMQTLDNLLKARADLMASVDALLPRGEAERP